MMQISCHARVGTANKTKHAGCACCGTQVASVALGHGSSGLLAGQASRGCLAACGRYPGAGARQSNFFLKQDPLPRHMGSPKPMSSSTLLSEAAVPWCCQALVVLSGEGVRLPTARDGSMLLGVFGGSISPQFISISTDHVCGRFTGLCIGADAVAMLSGVCLALQQLF